MTDWTNPVGFTLIHDERERQLARLELAISTLQAEITNLWELTKPPDLGVRRANQPRVGGRDEAVAHRERSRSPQIPRPLGHCASRLPTSQTAMADQPVSLPGGNDRTRCGLRP